MRLLDRIDKNKYTRIYETGLDNSMLNFINRTAEKSINFYVYHIKL